MLSARTDLICNAHIAHLNFFNVRVTVLFAMPRRAEIFAGFVPLLNKEIIASRLLAIIEN
jgi:hypothetical protein